MKSPSIQVKYTKRQSGKASKTAVSGCFVESENRHFQPYPPLCQKGAAMITLLTTADRKETLEQIGKVLLEQRLIACIQISGPVTSMYSWKGMLEEAQEWVGTMKTTGELYPRVEAELKRLHPYEVPEIVAAESSRVLPEYEEWVRAVTQG